MPIFEFLCGTCRRKTTALVLARRRVPEVRCGYCGSAELTQLYSRFATPKSEAARLESLADPGSLGDVDESDPHSVARWMKRMGREVGEDIGEDVDQALEQDLSAGGDGTDGGTED